MNRQALQRKQSRQGIEVACDHYLQSIYRGIWNAWETALCLKLEDAQKTKKVCFKSIYKYLIKGFETL